MLVDMNALEIVSQWICQNPTVVEFGIIAFMLLMATTIAMMMKIDELRGEKRELESVNEELYEILNSKRFNNR